MTVSGSGRTGRRFRPSSKSIPASRPPTYSCSPQRGHYAHTGDRRTVRRCRVAPDGTVCQTTYQSVTGQTYVTKIAPNGAVTVVDFRGHSRQCDSDRSQWHRLPAQPDRRRLRPHLAPHPYHPSGTPSTLNGAPILGTQIAPDGTAYVITGVGSWPTDLASPRSRRQASRRSARRSPVIYPATSPSAATAPLTTTYTDGPGGTVTTTSTSSAPPPSSTSPANRRRRLCRPRRIGAQSVSSGGVTRLVVIAPAPVVKGG